MRIVLLIDSLGSGGAQRQICMLAVLLKERGHDVRMLMYHPLDFFKPLLDQAYIPVEYVAHRGKWHRILALRRAIRAGTPDVVIAYLAGPSAIAELSGLPRRDFALIVSERSLEYPASVTPGSRFRFWLHRCADAVVTNSHAQEAAIRAVAPKLASRLATIVNCVDLEKFRPVAALRRDGSEALRMLCVGRFEREKNYRKLLEAVEILYSQHPEVNLQLDAYGDSRCGPGNLNPHASTFLELQEAVARSPVRGRFHLHGATADTAPLYQNSDVFCLASLFEGCSNVICEAMACGRAILASRVGDNPVLVEEGTNGFLFDPNSPADIADAILRFCRLSTEQRAIMGKASRQRAEEMLSPSKFIAQYEQLTLQIRLSKPRPMTDNVAHGGYGRS